MSETKVVQAYFDREAVRFDAIYEDQKPWIQRLGDRLCRGVVRHRLELVQTLAPLSGDWSALDVGCGTGRFGVALALRGASRVLGIDISHQMVEMGVAAAQASGVSKQCEFLATDYLAYNHDEQFDLVLALGYFDYLRHPRAHLEHMVRQCRIRLFASFPKRFEFRVPTRILRIRLSGGFVRFYSRSEITALVTATGVPPDRFTLIDLGRDYLLIVNRI